jgi:hypothetical protein
MTYEKEAQTRYILLHDREQSMCNIYTKILNNKKDIFHDSTISREAKIAKDDEFYEGYKYRVHLKKKELNLLDPLEYLHVCTSYDSFMPCQYSEGVIPRYLRLDLYKKYRSLDYIQSGLDREHD